MPFRTERDIARLVLPEGRADAYFFDANTRGLSVRLQGAKRTWVCHYSVEGKRRRLTLGDVDALPLKKARELAGEVVARATLGRDPLKERDTAKAAAATKRQEAARTFGRVADLYLEARQKADPTAGKKYMKPLRPKSVVEVRRTLEKHAAAIRHQRLGSIEPGDVLRILTDVWQRGGVVAAGRCRAHLSAFYGWAIDHGFASHNPVATVPDGYASQERDRVLTDAELAALWHATGELGRYGDIVRLLMLTACRSTEIGGMAWRELDLDAGLFHLPAERAKNGKAHTVALSAPALAIIERQERRGLFVFGHRAGFSDWSNRKRDLDELSGVSGWQLRDIRRTAVTGMQKLGIREEVAKTVLNHAKAGATGVTAIYARHSYAEEAATAWHRWADRILEVVGEKKPGGVVRLRA